MKGIILSGGYGTRLFPSTKAVCKQLLPIYDKPMIYYPMSILMLAKIKDILIISTPQDISRFEMIFKDGKDLGINISYKIQEKPRGLAESFILGEEFIGEDNVCLVLGDNIFYGHNLPSILQRAASIDSGAVIFGYRVQDPHRYGIVEFDENMNPIAIVEKPQKPKSNIAISGLYFYDNDVIDIAKKVKPSNRGELEITDVNNFYLEQKKLNVELLSRGYAWLDTGTFDSMQAASSFVQTIQKRQGIKIACLEEIAYNMGYIDKAKLLALANNYNNEYKDYLINIVSSPNQLSLKNLIGR